MKPDTQIALGLARSTVPVKQPDNTYRYARNVITDLENLGSLVNENGNVKVKDFDVVYSIALTNNEFILFTSNNQIIRYNTNTNLHTVLVQYDALNLDKVTWGEYKLSRGCDETIYWGNGRDTDKFLILNRLDDFKTGDDWDIRKFELTTYISHPKIKTELLSTGGKLRFGVYNFVVEYLDDAENVIYTSNVDINYTPVYNSLDKGGLNIDANQSEIGGQVETSKAIRLTISNVSDLAQYIRLNVIRTTTADGFTSDAHAVSELIPVNDSVIEYTYRGFTDGDYLIDKNELLIPLANYKSALTSEQLQNRLLKANLKEEVKDYSEYQKSASKICTKLLVKQIPKTDINIITECRTEIGGEVKDYGIVYVHKDGSESPVFHIPAVKSISTGVATKFAPKLQIGLLMFTISKQPYTLHWSIKYTVNNQVFTKTGTRTITKEDTLPEYDENAIEWVDVYVGYPTEIVEVIDTSYYTSGRTFGTISRVFSRIQNKEVNTESFEKDEIPEKGYYTSGKMSVYESDQTYDTPSNYCGDDYWGVDCNGNSLAGEPIRYHAFPSRSAIQLADTDNIYTYGVQFNNIEYPSDDIVGHYFVSNIRTNSTSRVIAKGLLTPFEAERSTKDDPDPFGSYFHRYGSGRIFALSNKANIITPEYLFLNKYIDSGFVKQEGIYGYMLDHTRIEYPDIFTSDTFDTASYFDGLRTISWLYSPTDYYKSSDLVSPIIRSYNIPKRSNYQSIINRSYSNKFNILEFGSNVTFPETDILRYVGVYSTTDIFTNLYAVTYRRITEINETESFNGDGFITPLHLTNIIDQDDKTKKKGDYAEIELESITNIYIESTVNMYLRHEGTVACNTFYDSVQDYQDWVLTQLIEPVDNAFRLKDPLCPVWLGYNEDYSRLSDFNKYRRLRLTYDYCSECNGLYPHRIIYSDPSFSEEQTDSYRIFKVNNYIDLPADKGEIIAIDYADNRLIVRTERTCFFIAPNPQQLQLSESTAYIGTGDFLSIPPQELNVVDIGYGGQLDPLESINTEYGLVWVDRTRRKVFLLAGKINEISNKDMESWFLDNMDLNTPCRVTYDTRSKRLILSQANNFTISYCFLTQRWKSFHDYSGSYYFYDDITFYSVNGGIWKHNSTNYCNFYGQQYPHEIEFTVKDFNSFNPDSIFYYQRSYLDNVYNKDYTYNQFFAYNEYQNTGLQNLVQSNYTFNHNDNQKYVQLNNRNWKIFPIRNMASGAPVLVNERPNNIITDLPQVKQGRFNDKWLSVRLIDTEGTHKIVFDYITTMKYYTDKIK